MKTSTAFRLRIIGFSAGDAVATACPASGAADFGLVVWSSVLDLTGSWLETAGPDTGSLGALAESVCEDRACLRGSSLDLEGGDEAA